MIKTITIDEAVKDYDKLKRNALKAMKKNNIKDTNKFIIAALIIAYRFNFRYSDDELEEILKKISMILLKKQGFTPIPNRFVFYDCMGSDNRGLTQQYLAALKDWDVEFLYILENSSNNAKEILNELKSIGKAEVFIAPESINEIEKMCIISEKIQEYKPEKAFLHLVPWSTTSIIIWNSFPNVERFLIDLTDHAFWLGKSCSDFFIGFRDYGYNISTKYRGIKPEHQLTQLYYPILNNYPFQGFPKAVEGKTIIFTGAAYYKVFGENNTFLKILKRICNENTNVAILFAGDGDSQPIIDFLDENKLHDQVFLIGNRKDINEVFKHADIYLNTFPIIGGLMSQYAIANKKPLIGYTTSDLPENFAEDLFQHAVKRNGLQFTFTDIEEFHNEINRLINDEAYRIFFTENYTNLLPTKLEFSKSLWEKITNKETLKDKEPNMKIDIERFMNLYANMENNYLHMYHWYKLSNIGWIYFKYDFLSAVVSSLNILFYQRNKLIKLIIGKLNKK